MKLEDCIKIYLKNNNCKPKFYWRNSNYLNGFLVHIPNYSQIMLNEFTNIMIDYCEKGYFTAKSSDIGLNDYILTEKGVSLKKVGR